MKLRIPVSYSGPRMPHPDVVHPEPSLDFQDLLEDMLGRLMRGGIPFRANYGWGLRNFAGPDREAKEEAVYNGLPEALRDFLMIAYERQEGLELDLMSEDLEEMLREQLLWSLGIKNLSEARQKNAAGMSRKDFLAAIELTVETGDLAAFDG